MTESILNRILIDIERAETLEELRQCCLKALTALIAINAEVEKMKPVGRHAVH